MTQLRKLWRRVSGQERHIRTADPARTSAELRSMVLHLKPDKIGLSPSAALPHVWGVLMEYWIEKSLVTLICLGDGTTSMYFGSGGGMIGLGAHERVSAAASQFIRAAEELLPQLPPTPVCTIPRPGNVSLHLLTFDGYHSMELPEGELDRGAHPLALLWAHGQEVITQARLQVG